MITSTSNAQIKELAKLQKKSRLRDERRIFLVEGPRMVEEIPKERIERLYISESFERKNPAYAEGTIKNALAYAEKSHGQFRFFRFNWYR